MLPAIDPLTTRMLLDLRHTASLLGCRFDPSGRYLFAAGQDSAILRIDITTGKKTILAGHTSWVRGLAFVAAPSPITPVRSFAKPALLGGGGVEPLPEVNPFLMISGDYHGNLIWWGGHEPIPKPLRTVAAHSGWIRAVAVSPDGCTVATCGNDNLVKLWSSADGRHLHTFEGHNCHVYNMAFHPDRRRFVSADHHGIIKDWDLPSGKLVRELDSKLLYKYDTGFMAHIGGIRGMSFDAAGTALACCGVTNVSNAFAGVGNPGVLVFDWLSGKSRTLALKDAYTGTGWAVHIHDGFVIAAGGNVDGRAWFWKLADAGFVHAVTLPVNTRDLALHPGGTAFAIATHGGYASIYSMVKA